MTALLIWIVVGLAVLLAAGTAVAVVRSRQTRAIDQAAPAPLDGPHAAPAAVEGGPASPELAAAPVLSSKLGAARSLFDKVRALRGRTTLGAAELDELEEALLRADVGTSTTAAILDAVKVAAAAGELGDDGITGALRRELLGLLGPPPAPLSSTVAHGRVAVWLFVGVNGVGKTTTIGKLASARTGDGETVLLAAGDTFRAAAADQLAMWAERVGCDIVRADEGADPGAVVHDALHRAASKQIGLVLADTAGRLHNKANLLEELKKVRRVADRDPGDVTEVLLVVDATTGQNAIAQAREFSEAVGVTGLCSPNSTARHEAASCLPCSASLASPCGSSGSASSAEDLVAFDPTAFVDALLGD